MSIIRRLCISFILLSLVSPYLIGQVKNDNIIQRSQLDMNAQPTRSSTNMATVEWQCVNKKLTNKCLVYHNDQWFTFTPPSDGKYFINLSADQCKDNRGIQAIVIQGNPCEVSTYRILKCISQIRFRESFIEIDSMVATTPYLINIDGFLGDLCEFSIQFSSTAAGLSVDAKAEKVLALTLKKGRGINYLSWILPSPIQDSVVSFSIYRSSDNKLFPLLRGTVPVAINAKGEYQLTYSFTDTLEYGSYDYQIVGNMRNAVQVVLDRMSTGSAGITRNDDYWIAFSLAYRNRSKLQILLVDLMRDVVLEQNAFEFNEVLDKNQRWYIGDYVKKGISKFAVVVVNEKTHAKSRILFFVDDQGKVTKQ